MMKLFKKKLGGVWRLVIGTDENLVARLEGIGTETQRRNGERLATCWNACEGLDIAPDIPAGAITALLTAARAVDQTTAGPRAIAELRAALAPFTVVTPDDIKARLEYLRGELEAARISWDELHELQSLAKFIDDDDVQLLEAAGVTEEEYQTRLEARSKA